MLRHNTALSSVWSDWRQFWKVYGTSYTCIFVNMAWKIKCYLSKSMSILREYNAFIPEPQRKAPTGRWPRARVIIPHGYSAHTGKGQHSGVGSRPHSCVMVGLVACVAGPQFYGGTHLERAQFFQVRGENEGLHECPAFLTTRRSESVQWIRLSDWSMSTPWKASFKAVEFVNFGMFLLRVQLPTARFVIICTSFRF